MYVGVRAGAKRFASAASVAVHAAATSARRDITPPAARPQGLALLARKALTCESIRARAARRAPAASATALECVQLGVHAG